MCGLLAVWDRGAPATAPGVLDRMLAALAHRGPDDAGTWRGGDLFLGHRRLSILDLGPGGHQPMATPDGRAALVYNGEVYNYRALRVELEALGESFTSTGDAQVLFGALRRYGPRATVERLDGMFAFAWYDAREEALWLARDRLGIKPLHVAVVGARVLVASEVKAFLEHPDFAVRPDMQALVALVARSRVDAPWTPFEGVETVPPGGLWRVDRRGIERGRWYDLIERVEVDRLVAGRARRPAEVVAALADRLAPSVERHLASDVPLATMCSGGVDSSLVTALARRHRPDLSAYVADIAGQASEAPAAAAVARHLGVALRPVPVDREAWLRTWPEAIWMREAPSFHPSDAAHLLVARRCRADGVRVLLTGEGADELLGGYRWQVRLAREWAARGRRRWLMGRGRRARRAEREAFSPLAEGPGRREGDLRERLCAGLQMAREMRGAALWERLAPLARPGERALAAQGLEDLHTHLESLLLRHDRAGMGAGLEMRVPFLSNAVIDFGLHLHPRFKLRRGVAKWALRGVAAAHLPRATIRARKRGFPVPPAFHAGTARLLRRGRAGELLRWDRAHEDRLLGRVEANSTLRYLLVGVELWARLFLHGERPDALGEWVLGAPAGP